MQRSVWAYTDDLPRFVTLSVEFIVDESEGLDNEHIAGVLQRILVDAFNAVKGSRPRDDT